MPPTALVTGATGCVGANTVLALLERGYSVRALCRTSSSRDALDGLDPEMVIGDILDPDSLRSAMRGCSLVFHSAAISDYWRHGPDDIYQVNVAGTRNVLSTACDLGVERLVFTSSIGSLGVPPRGQMLTEDSPFNLNPQAFPYGHSKLLAEQAVRQSIGAGLDAVIVNPSGVIGARDVHFISGSLLAVTSKGLGLLAPPGGLNWVDAEIVGLGHVLAAEIGECGEKYILGGHNLSHQESLTTIAKVLGKRPPVAALPSYVVELAALAAALFGAAGVRPLAARAEQARLSAHHVYCDTTKAEKKLGLPRVPFRASVESAYRWYRSRGYL
jgi:dihydroflavonol-4-reductase